MKNYQEMKILIVDDDTISIGLIKNILEKSGYSKIQAVTSAKEGLAVVQNKPPDLILLDIIMPDMNGYDFCTCIKADDKTMHIPIVMITGGGLDADEAIEKAFEVGATDFVTKPIRSSELLTRVKSVLKLKKYHDNNQEKLLKSRTYFKSIQADKELVDKIIETSLCSIVVADHNGCITSVNNAYLQMLGYEQEEIIGKYMVELAPQEAGVYETTMGEKIEIGDKFFNNSREMITTLFEQGKVPQFEGYTIRKDGKVVLTEENNVLLYNEKGEVATSVSIILDITERKLAENKLLATNKQLKAREQELRAVNQQLVATNQQLIASGRDLSKLTDYFEKIYNTTADGIIFTQNGGTISKVNKAMENILGFREDELIGKHTFELSLQDGSQSEIGAAMVEQLYQNGRVENIELNWRRKDGSFCPVELNITLLKDEDGTPTGSVCAVRDVTERQKAEEEKKKLGDQLKRAEKMEALGTLAGGIAHDLNNILGAIVGYPDLLLDDITEDNPMRSSILAIKESGERAASIVQDLLTLARRGVSVTEVLSLNTIIYKYLESSEYKKLKEFHHDVLLEKELDSALLNIRGSPVHLSKVVMNLVLNAAEAMPSGGKISIFSENRYLDTRIKGYDNIKEGDYVVLTVSDTGVGMSDEELGQIFEPFYTKKVMGKSGTGLGMAVVWGTVKDHKGYIDIISKEGQGSTFKIYFPVSRDEVREAELSVSIEEYAGSGENILVVDDIEAQRDIATKLLKKLNYNIETVSSGEEAIEYMKNNTADLLILDMIMDPGIDGLETYKSIIEIHPGQKAIIASGFSETDRVKEAQKLGAGAYIKKPYTLEKIGLAVKQELKK